MKLKAVEMARGHDGFLRGRPEPALIVAAYVASETDTLFLDRALCRLDVNEAFPCEVVPEQTELFRATVPRLKDSRVLVLGLALEEDTGEDVRSVYAALDKIEDDLLVWSEQVVQPAPTSILETARGVILRPPDAMPVNLLMHGADVGDICHSDSLIGACMIVLDTTNGAFDEWRMPFLSTDGRNDWAARLLIRW